MERRWSNHQMPPQPASETKAPSQPTPTAASPVLTPRAARCGRFPNVNVNGRPAIRVDDPGIHTACCGGNTWNAQTGSKSVFINGKPPTASAT